MRINHQILVQLALACMGAFALAGPASAQETEQARPGTELHQDKARQGWFFYRDPKKDEKKSPPPPTPPAPAASTPQVVTAPLVVVGRPASKEDKEKLCKQKDSWTQDCGFVDPGDDFEFQAKQRDILLQQMSLRPDVPEAVEAAQRYMKWVVGRASMAANMWYFNMTQKPELDPTVKNPISEVGIALATRVTQATQGEYFRLIQEEGGKLFFFSRDDCSYCHVQAPYTQRVARTMGLELINVPLDGKCLEGFSGETCADNIKPEQYTKLDVSIVPTLYLYVPSNTWLRLATGVSSDTTVLANTVNFFSAYRAAMLAGLDNGNGVRPSVSFDPAIRGQATGVAPADGSRNAAEPDRTKIMELLGYKPASGSKQ